jgi:membrane protein DedA with SNARE-associated domain
MEFVHQATGLIEAHRAWAALLVGVLAMGESIIVIGVLVPATAVLVVVGGFVGAGLLEPWPIILGAAIGGSIGDAISYYIGVWLGRGSLHRPPFDRYRDAIARTRLFLRRYGFFAVFFGRFFGPIQATVPLVAGVLGMSARRFQTANVVSALLWAPLVLSPGWLIARSWRRIIVLTELHWFRPAAIVALLIVAGIGLAIGVYLRGKSRADAAFPPA